MNLEQAARVKGEFDASYAELDDRLRDRVLRAAYRMIHHDGVTPTQAVTQSIATDEAIEILSVLASNNERHLRAVLARDGVSIEDLAYMPSEDLADIAYEAVELAIREAIGLPVHPPCPA